MDRKSLWISLIAVVISFIGGFLVANSINRSELELLRGENDRLKTSSAEAAKTASEFTLTNQEIDQKIAEAEQNSSDFTFQKRLGIALYRYGSMKQSPEIITKALPVLERASRLNANDHEVTVGLGNAYFDIGYYGKDNAGFEKAREYYERALELKPDDIEVRTDVGLTYYLHEPPDLKRAVENFQKSLEADASHEKTLQFIVQALIKDQKTEEAEKYLAQLRKTSPTSPAVGELTTIIANAKQGINK